MSVSESTSDAALIERARNGDRAAFSRFVERHQARVLATITAMLGPQAGADDLAQEAFIRFYLSLDRFRGESSALTYLTRIAMNLTLNALKRRRSFRSRFLSRDEIDSLDNIPGPEVDMLEVNDRVTAVNRALDRLDRNQRAVIVLRLMDGFSTRETAEILDIPVGTVLSRLSRGQMRLREILNPLLNEPESERNDRR